MINKTDGDEPEYRCNGCGHPKNKHDNLRWQCLAPGCDCNQFKRPAIKLPMMPRIDIDQTYRLAPNEIFTMCCPECGYYDVGNYAGLDIKDIKGQDYVLEKDYNILCNICEGVFNIPAWMQLGYLVRGMMSPQDMAKNKNLPRHIRKILLKTKQLTETEEAP